MKQNKEEFTYTDQAKVGDVIIPYQGKEIHYGIKVPSGKEKDARYVVIDTAMTGGGTGHGPHDIYPDGWQVSAKKLNTDGSYNPEGEEIQFYQSGCFNTLIEEVPVLGKLEQVFIPAELAKEANLEGIVAYQVRTEGDVEGKHMRTLGYATGKPEDIKEFYDNEKMYKIWLDEIKILHIDAETCDRRKKVNNEISELEKKLEELREQRNTVPSPFPWRD